MYIGIYNILEKAGPKDNSEASNIAAAGTKD